MAYQRGDSQKVTVQHGRLSVTLVFEEGGQILIYADKRYLETGRAVVTLPLQGLHDAVIDFEK